MKKQLKTIIKSNILDEVWGFVQETDEETGESFIFAIYCGDEDKTIGGDTSRPPAALDEFFSNLDGESQRKAGIILNRYLKNKRGYQYGLIN